jgi:hypothetical protein
MECIEFELGRSLRSLKYELNDLKKMGVKRMDKNS